MASLVSNKPAKKNSKWSTEENAIIIELRGRGMKWDEASKRLPGRSAISCRLHYQNYLERRSEWDEERKNKLARLYERFKSDMWAKVAEELAVPWRAAEAMHWQLGEADMARRAGVVPFSFATTNTSESPNSRTLTSQVRASRDLVNLDPVQPQIISAPQETTSSAPPTSYSRSQPISPMTSAQTPPQGHINSHSPPLQQPRRRGSRRPMQSTPRPSCEATPREPRSSPVRTTIPSQSLDHQFHSSGPELPSIQLHPSSLCTGPLPRIPQLTKRTSPYGPSSELPMIASLSAINTSSMLHYVPSKQAGTKRPTSFDTAGPFNTNRRGIETFLPPLKSCN